MQAIKGQRPPKVPPKKKISRSQVHNLCSGVPPTDKVRKKTNATDQGAQAPKSSAEKKKISRSQDVSCPIIVRNGKKVHKVCKISC